MKQIGLLSAVAMVAIAGVALAQRTPQRVLIEDAVGCHDLADLRDFTRLIGEGDKEAARSVAETHCTHLYKGIPGFVEDVSVFGYVCLRLRGIPKGFWVFIESTTEVAQ
jgi:hypothetical protein